MDAEPGRCRRTDGKKWRCYQSVVPNEKYCIKHMHRGRKRSRKLVEDDVTPNVASEAPAILIKKSQPLLRFPSMTLTDAVARMDEKTQSSVSTQSVRQDDHGCSEVQREANGPRQVLRRCSRKDGRKWQCHNEAIPGQKYCGLHVHRGLKKPHPAISPSATAETKATRLSFSSSKLSESEEAKTGVGLDTDLNISLLDPRPDIGESVTGSRSSSDASTETTISDDSAYISNMITVSPRMQ
ncbi:hypothetical protein RND81_02G114400 [Saponaria officinalis]